MLCHRDKGQGCGSSGGTTLHLVKLSGCLCRTLRIPLLISPLSGQGSFLSQWTSYLQPQQLVVFGQSEAQRRARAECSPMGPSLWALPYGPFPIGPSLLALPSALDKGPSWEDYLGGGGEKEIISICHTEHHVSCCLCGGGV